MHTLGKARRLNFILIHDTNLYLRSETLRFILMQLLSAGIHSTTYRQES